MTILPGHIPNLSKHAAKAVSAVQRLPEEEKTKLLEMVLAIKLALSEQEAFDKRVADSLTEAQSETESVTESLLLPYMFGGA